ncbi:MAG: ABC transporter permease [Verrucomicrobiales bacterium]|nr:ABC transporter permease [Verrucomicrobiales bacterium]
MNLAAKDIRHNIGRFALTTVGIGMLLMVVMGMGGIYRGIVADATMLIDEIGADIWVVQKDTRGPFAEISRLPANLLYRVESVRGVEDVREFVFHTVQRDYEGSALRIAILGLSWPRDTGAWVSLIEGRPLVQNHYEMIADESLGLSLGEKIQLGKESYEVVGITKSMISAAGDGIGFVTAADALAIQFNTSGEALRLERAARKVRGENSDIGANMPILLEQASRASAELPAFSRPQISAVMASISPGVDPAQVIAKLEGWSDVSVYTSQGQRDLLLKGTVEKVRLQIGLFRVLLTIIAAIIMALILYTLTLDKIHTIALLKLVGAPNSRILGLIIQESLFIGVLGFGIAYLVGQRLFPNFPRRVILTNEDLLQLGMIVIVISIASSFLGIWKAMRVSPNEALS